MMQALCISIPTQPLSLHNRHVLSLKRPYQRANTLCNLASPHQLRGHLSTTTITSSSSSSFLGFNPLRSAVDSRGLMKRRRRGFCAVCFAGALSVKELQWVSTICTAVLMLASGTAINKSFLVPLFALQAPASIITWIKGEYGIWSAFLALLVRLFFGFPDEFELPFMALLMVIVAPCQAMNLRGDWEGAVLALLIATYLAFQHFSREGSMDEAFDRGSIITTVAITLNVAAPLLLLIGSPH